MKGSGSLCINKHKGFVHHNPYHMQPLKYCICCFYAYFYINAFSQICAYVGISIFMWQQFEHSTHRAGCRQLKYS